MISFSGAKINLGLHVLSKRDDGFHNIESAFYPIPWFDTVEIIKSNEFSFSSSGLVIDSLPEHNLCVKAFMLLKNKFNIPNVHIHLHKVIPFGAGLGGGSSNAATVLKTLNKIFYLDLKNEQLIELASELGSDCAFFIRNKPVFATQKGSNFEDIDIKLSGNFIILIKPDLNINTKTAYSKVITNQYVKSIKDIVNKPIENWKDEMFNSFEQSIFYQHPEIGKLKNFLYDLGFDFALMSGSGSTVFGITKSKELLEKAQVYFNNQHKEYTLFSTEL